MTLQWHLTCTLQGLATTNYPNFGVHPICRAEGQQLAVRELNGLVPRSTVPDSKTLNDQRESMQETM
jgi:hypothetical protein